MDELVPVRDPQNRYTHSRWAEPSIGQAARALRQLAQDADYRAGLGLRGRTRLAEALGGDRWIDRTGVTLPARASLDAGFR